MRSSARAIVRLIAVRQLMNLHGGLSAIDGAVLQRLPDVSEPHRKNSARQAALIGGECPLLVVRPRAIVPEPGTVQETMAIGPARSIGASRPRLCRARMAGAPRGACSGATGWAA
jgi:hypothetical protein